MKTVGVIGGMGPLATQEFYAGLVRETQAERDQDHLHVLIDSDPGIPDRTAFLLGEGVDPRPRLLAAARRLREAGAELGVMPCNTANVWREELAEASGLPIVPWLETAVDAALGNSGGAVGLLATSGTLRAGVYQELLDQRGAKAILPTASEQEDVMGAIYGPDGVKASGSASPARRASLHRVIAALVARGASSVLLACTELPLALPGETAASGVRLIDPALMVARRVIVEAGGRLRTAT